MFLFFYHHDIKDFDQKIISRKNINPKVLTLINLIRMIEEYIQIQLI